jgi:hypothetical protein
MMKLYSDLLGKSGYDRQSMRRQCSTVWVDMENSMIDPSILFASIRLRSEFSEQMALPSYKYIRLFHSVEVVHLQFRRTYFASVHISHFFTLFSLLCSSTSSTPNGSNRSSRILRDTCDTSSSMHSLNPYLEKKPDFALLASKYPSFAP